MENILVVSILALLGLVMGSFAGALVWRLRARQLVEDKAVGEEVDAKEYKKLTPLTKSGFREDRSRCLHCGHTLKWYDLIPLVSWVSTGGKCRYCGKWIGWFEPAVELGTALLFVGSYMLWPFPLMTTADIAVFVFWLVAVVLLIILFVYDLKWFLLPNAVVFPLIGVGIAIALIRLTQTFDVPGALLDYLFASAILSGLYLLLWAISKGRWIGFGDVKLGLALALILGSWQLAFVALFAANLIGSLIVLPGMVTGKISRTARVPFGPLLIAGALFALFVGDLVLNWYFVSFA